MSERPGSNSDHAHAKRHLMGSIQFTAADLPADATFDVWPDGTVGIKYGPHRQHCDRLDVFFEKIADCYRLRCLICDGLGYVISGNDGGECDRCGGARFDPDPVEANELRARWAARNA